MTKFTTVNLCIVVMVAMLIACDRAQSMQSYDGNRYQETSNAYGDNNNGGVNGYNDVSSEDYNNDGYNGEERPKIKLNIGLHIPAMAIQMPKRLLPKITIRAKVRQPNRPSVMYVPEIQIDKNSNLPGPEGSKPASTGGHNNNNYQSSSDYGENKSPESYNNYNNNNNYANQQPAAQISTLSYQDGGVADSSYGNNNYYTNSSPQPMQYSQSASNEAYKQQRYLPNNQYSGPVQQTRPVDNYFNQFNYQQRPATQNYQPVATVDYNQQGYNNLGLYNENSGANRFSGRYN